MQRLLVGLTVDKNGDPSSSAIVIDVPDTYKPIDDSSSDKNPFTQLRNWIYEEVVSKPDIFTDESDYEPDNMFVMGINVLGYVDADGLPSTVN